MMPNNNIPFSYVRYHANSLCDFFDIIRIISSKMKEQYKKDYQIAGNLCPQLWFRGHANIDFILLPTLLRNNGDTETKDKSNIRYTSSDLQEDYYFHSFSGRVGHQIDSGVNTRTAWSEVMQHHSLPTRMLDWSLSAMSALTFALGKLLDPTQKDVSPITPVILVQCPFFINREVYKMMANIDLIESALSDIERNPRRRTWMAKRLMDAMHDLDNVDYHSVAENINRRMCSPKAEIPTVDGIVSLSAISSTLNIDSERLNNMLYNVEINPYFYLIYRYYIDAIPVAPDKLPPLSVLHRYHSKRIEAQSGTFSVFPCYSLKSDAIDIHKTGIDTRCMEFFPKLQPYLFSIQIDNPYKVSREIYESGGRYSAVYPEVERYAHEITFSSPLF